MCQKLLKYVFKNVYVKLVHEMNISEWQDVYAGISPVPP